MNRKYIVYEHVSIDGKRYFGITSQKPNTRWRQGNGYIKNKHFYRSILKHGWENFEHNIILSDVDENIAKEKEQELIKLYNTTNPKYGYNITKGGDNRPPCPDHVRKKISEKTKGRIVSEETRKKMSIACKNKPKRILTKEHKEKISKSLIGNKRALGKKSHGKMIAMCDKENNIIKVYKGATEASLDNNCNNSSINQACRENLSNNGLENTKYGGVYKGYKWFYLDENNNIINNNKGIKLNKRNTIILQYDLNHNLINIFNKIKDAALYNNISKNGLSFALKGKNKTIYKNFIWEKQKDAK